MIGNQDAAFQSYEGVESLLSENPQAKGKTFVEWSEEALYRATLLGLREGYEYVIVNRSVLQKLNKN